MSAPSDGARADARKARAEQAALPDVRESVSLAELTSVIFGHVGPLTWTSRTEELVQVQLARTILGSDWLAGVIADAKAEVLNEVIALERGADPYGVTNVPVQWVREIRDRIESGR